MRTAIGIDLGGTNIKAGVVDERGKVLSRVSLPTGGEDGYEAILDRIAQAALEAREAAGVPWKEIATVGLGGPGSFVGLGGVNHHTPNLPALEGREIYQPLRKRLGRQSLPLTLENDANVAAYAEAWVGVGRGVKTLTLFTLGTGIGGGIILDGKIWRGAWGTAAELGHMSLFPDGVLCNCGNRGCVEAYASATALVRRFKEAVKSGRRTSLAPTRRQAGPITARDIDGAAKAGDKLCVELIEETGRYLGIAVMNMLVILNVELVVFTGGMTASGAMLLKPIRDEARRRTFPLAMKNVRIIFSRSGDDAGLIGAAGWAMNRAVAGGES